jgi:NitT/TauT family transport system substrate-binding protein
LFIAPHNLTRKQLIGTFLAQAYDKLFLLFDRGTGRSFMSLEQSNASCARVRALQALIAGLMAVVLACALIACGTQKEQTPSQTGTEQGGSDKAALAPAATTEVRVSSLKGPTSIGLVRFMDEASRTPDDLANSYTFNIVGTADEIAPGLASGDIDIALVPANLSAVLYNRTEGGITALDINTLGVLYVVSADASIASLDDLSGKTVLMTGKGTTPEYVMNYLLAQSGLTDRVTLEYKSEATEVAALIAADPTAIAVLPEPYVTSVTMKDPNLAVRVSLTEEWDRLQGAAGGRLITGVTVVRTAFLKEHPEAVQEFLEHQTASVASALEEPAAAASLVVEAGIIDNAQIVERAIPNCNLTCYFGAEMKADLSGYLAILFEQDPASVGGALPNDDFYYSGG